MKTLRAENLTHLEKVRYNDRVSLSDEQEDDDHVDESKSDEWIERLEHVFPPITSVCEGEIR